MGENKGQSPIQVATIILVIIALVGSWMAYSSAGAASTKGLATKSDLKDMATKSDLNKATEEMISAIKGKKVTETEVVGFLHGKDWSSAKSILERAGIEVPKITPEKVSVLEAKGISMEPKSFTWATDPFVMSLPLFVAKEKGYFKDLNLDVKLKTYSMGVDTMDAIIANRAKLGIGAHWALMMRCAKAPDKIGLVSNFNNRTAPEELYVSPKIDSLKDLKGKALGIIKGTVWEYATAYAIKKAGLDYPEDITIKGFKSPSEYLAAAIAGDVAGGWFWEDYLDKAKEKLGPKGWHTLVDKTEVLPRSVVGCWGVIPGRKPWVKKNPDAVARALYAFWKASIWIRQNHEAAGKIMADYLDMPEKAAIEAIPGNHFYVGLAGSHIKAIQKMIEWTVKRGYLKEKFQVTNQVLSKPLEKLFPSTVTYK